MFDLDVIINSSHDFTFKFLPIPLPEKQAREKRERTPSLP
jgi:hypothetical protein